jgi:hypothetical protein
MPIQDLFAIPTQREKLQEEKAIVSAVVRYFERMPPRNADRGEMEPSIINALHRYFEVNK